MIEKIAPEVKITEGSEKQAEELSAIVIDRIKQNLSGKSGVISGSEVPYADEEEDAGEEAEVNVPAELEIPEALAEEPEEASPTEVRDAPEFAEEEKEASDEIVIERTKLPTARRELSIR